MGLLSKLRILALATATFATASPAAGAAPATGPTAEPTPNAAAEALFAKARTYWRTRTDVPYLRYGALVRYLHNGHVFDNWWDAYERTADKAIGLQPLVDPVENNRRIAGVPFSIFGIKVFDTNRDAEPIRVGEPRIDPTSSFGVTGRSVSLATPAPPVPATTDPQLREIGSVAASVRAYDIEIAGTEHVDDVDTTHLTFVPLRDPGVNRIRDLWLDPQTGRPVRMVVQGILSGKPYDEVPWTIRYTLVDGREYVQQLIADEPLKFGFEATVSKFEFDFVDFHFPSEAPQFTFDRPF
ncbi:MAG: hypothetical protein IAI48_18625 [Candidatus Eremiobacteraeota bacterium]|nr:hypothetical protein [Candidatus Eremiobacteraeota bacterium]